MTRHGSRIRSPQNLQLPVDENQDLLETVDPIERLNRIGDILEIELEKTERRTATSNTRREAPDGARAKRVITSTKSSRAIQKELGRGEKKRNRRAEKEDRHRRDVQGSA